MDSQLILTLAYILVALAYLLRQLFHVFRSWRAGSCGNTCGCPSQANPTNPPLITQLTLKPKRS